MLIITDLFSLLKVAALLYSFSFFFLIIKARAFEKIKNMQISSVSLIILAQIFTMSQASLFSEQIAKYLSVNWNTSITITSISDTDRPDKTTALSFVNKAIFFAVSVMSTVSTQMYTLFISKVKQQRSTQIPDIAKQVTSGGHDTSLPRYLKRITARNLMKKHISQKITITIALLSISAIPLLQGEPCLKAHLFNLQRRKQAWSNYAQRSHGIAEFSWSHFEMVLHVWILVVF
ncbi:hypothetical protein FGO68_gene8811 [Halteria grandinella]|uniref:Uncharacterized protein n=1 Tax=Halteria grandinella TaxID=5974 RepID=A0A8J8NPU4_HALGN|nr:hypothetical protein FGO68_gene8811 [Halteria grandinella]